MNIIVSGVSSGIGKAIIKCLDSMDIHRVIGFSRSQEKLDNLSKELNSSKIELLSIDLTKDEDIIKLQEKIIKWDTIDVLINNAGLLVNKPFENLTRADFDNSYYTNVYGVAHIIQTLINKLKKSKAAHVLNISSVGGVQGSMKFPGLAFYSSSKAALIGLTECLSEEYKESSLAFNCLALGAVQTEMLEEAFPGYEAPISAEEMGEYVVDFALKGNKFHKGKTIQVSVSTP